MHAESMPCPVFAQSLRALEGLARLLTGRYSLPVAANSATGFGDPRNLAHRRPYSHCRRFFCARNAGLWRSCVGDRKVCRVPSSRFANLRTAATHSVWRRFVAAPIQLGASPMKHSHALNPSAIQQHAAALKARAFAALRADSSLSVRLRRYNEAMAKARALEAIGGEQ